MHLPEIQTPTLPSEHPTTTTTTITPEQLTTETITPQHEKKSKHLYFAYGSNLSPTQMTQRCVINPTLSASPVALAKLDGWSWFICEFGYANVLPPTSLRVESQEDSTVREAEEGEGEVYGVLYEMDEDDEGLLDRYEAVDYSAPAAGLGGRGKVDRKLRPREQGIGDYNKWYLDARVVAWLDETQREKRGAEEVQKVLVYVDEERVDEARPKNEYVGRMNRGIREAVGLGLSREWVDRVMRRFIPDI